MASHFKWYPSDEEVVVPFNARYSFPSQANKSVKLTPRIPPKTGSTYTPGQIIRLEFPAQGYVNPQNTTLEFDVQLFNYGTPNDAYVRFQNNIQSIFQRVRLLYGATPIEDIINYNVITRCLTEWTGTNQIGTLDQSSIAEGIGGVVVGPDSSSASVPKFGLLNVRQFYIQGVGSVTPPVGSVGHFLGGTTVGPVPNSSCIRRYQVSFALGLFTQEKLIPTKYMASQLAIEITLENPAACLFVSNTGTAGAGSDPTYSVQNVNLIPEILEFDASYDAMFLQGLRDGGVPIKFSSWHSFIFGTGGAANVNLQVQERSRSVKALFAVQRRNPVVFGTDSHATLFASNTSDGVTANTLQSYQFRIGGRYFPAAPVQCSTAPGSSTSNGGAEAFIELQKALNIVGDYRLSTSANNTRWALGPATATVNPTGVASPYAEFDYTTSIQQITGSSGAPTYSRISFGGTAASANGFAGNLGSQCFGMAIDLETSNGVEISGLNAEEQSDISLIANWAGPQNPAFVLEVYSYYDAMIILRENNVLELIQ